ncbi:MAG: TonB-dependent receptor [Acidobacteriia bacterium]|nr:TonB-dependent receptor [Terriglobia bacterium]
MKTFCVRLFGLLFLSILPAVLYASPQGQLSGVVTDSTGGSVAGVHVSAVPEGAAAVAVTAVSGAQGQYSLALAPGNYHVRFEKEAFATREIAVQLGAGEARTLDLRLELERLSSRVLVTAQTEPLEAAASPAPSSIYSRKEMDQRGAIALADLLQDTPGVSIWRTGAEGGMAAVSLNGGNSNFVKVLVDGTPVNDPGGAVDFSNVTLDNVDKVEVVRGAESALYGTDAVSGVIQIISHRGTTRTPAVNMFTEGGGFATARGGAQLSGLLGKFDYSGAASYFNTDGQGPNDGLLNRTVSGNFGWSFSQNNQLRLTLRNTDSDAGIPGQTLFEPANLDQHSAMHSFSAGQRWNFTSGAHWRHELSASESYSRELNDNPGQDFYNPLDPYCPLPSPGSTAVSSSYCDYTFTDRSEFNRTGFRAQSSYVAPKFGATAGYQYEVENGYMLASYSGFVQELSHRRASQGGFLDLRWTPLSRLLLSGGVRAEANGVFGTRVVPRFGASYALRASQGFWGDTRARVFYGQGIKEPRMDQSYTLGADPCYPGNPDLRPERSRTWSAGIEQKLASDKVRISAEYFQNRFYDMVSFTYCAFGGQCPVAPPAGCVWGFGTFFNTDLSRARGTNIAVEVKPLHWLSLAGNYSYDDSLVLSSPNAWDPAMLPGNRLLRRPSHSGSLIANASFRAVNVNLSGYFTGERTDSDFLYLGMTSNPGYARFDFATSYAAAKGVTFHARIANLFDKQYQDALGYPALGREFRMGANYRFGGKK